MLPTLSVTMSNYNHGHYIGGALDAILSQSARPGEVIVIDDASTDNSIEVIQSVVRRDPVVRLIRNGHNMGILANCATLLEMAAGDYIYSAAADDFVLTGFFEKSLSLLEQHPQAGLCVSDAGYIDGLTKRTWCNRLAIDTKPCYLSPEETVGGCGGVPSPCRDIRAS